MFTWGTDKSRTLVALPDANARKNLVKMMRSAGFTHTREVATLPQLVELLSHSDVDLLITTLNDRDWDSFDLIRRIRTGAVGNPFILIMVLLDAPWPAIVNRVVNSGADDLLLAPWQERLVLGRLDGLLHGRKRFVVTHDYVGPERRNNQSRPGSALAQAVDVPNPMHMLTIGPGNRETLKRAVNDAQDAINLAKIKSFGHQLRYLADRIVATFAENGPAAIIPDILTMLASADELAERAVDTHFSPAIELTESLRVLCHRLSREDRVARAAEVGVLPSLADAVIAALQASEAETLQATSE